MSIKSAHEILQLSGVLKILFKGEPFVLVDGAIATEEQYENFEMSTAHLFHDGKVRRFNEVIGTFEDIELLV